MHDLHPLLQFLAVGFCAASFCVVVLASYEAAKSNSLKFDAATTRGRSSGGVCFGESRLGSSGADRQPTMTATEQAENLARKCDKALKSKGLGGLGRIACRYAITEHIPLVELLEVARAADGLIFDDVGRLIDDKPKERLDRALSALRQKVVEV